MHSFLFALQGDGASPSPASGIIDMVVMFGGIFVIMYFLVLRPQRRQERARQDMLSQIGKNDKIVTSGGIHGVVMSVRDDDVTIRVDEEKNVRIRVSRSAVANVILDDAKPAE